VPVAASAAQVTEAFDCGSKTMTVWLRPKGNPKGWAGFEKDGAALAYAFNGWSPPSADPLAAAIHAGIAGIEIGVNCAPKGAPRLRAEADRLVQTSAATRLRCAFPSHPLIQIETMPDGTKRLVLVVARRIVVKASTTLTRAAVAYAKELCSVAPS
jgi:hypothetical protein